MKRPDLRRILQRVPRWPVEAQLELMRSVTEIETRYSRIYHVSDDERIALEHSGEDVKRSLFATDDEIKDILGRFHRA
jgi:hypothetical protein